MPTPDYVLCDSKKLDIQVLDDSTPPALKLASTDFFQNSDIMTFRNDENFVYVDFLG